MKKKMNPNLRPAAFQIGNRIIGDGHPCFIIAEAGSNHNGNFDQAIALIDVAVAAKADAVKFQTFRAEKLYLKTAGESHYLQIKKSIFEIIKDMEMPADWIPKLARYCKQKNVIFLSTPTDEECADLIEPYVPAYKIASYELTTTPLLEYIAQKQKPMILSTGASDLEEVRHAIQAVHAAGNRQVAVMQCTASYPTPLQAVNTQAIVTMKREFGIPVGLSDHSREPDVAPMTAVALGANLLEKHFTLSNQLPGPDHRFAVEPGELKALVEKVRSVEAAMGSGFKEHLPIEKELRQFARRSIFAIQNVKQGDSFTRDNIATLRCGTQKGILHPQEFKCILHKTAVRDIKAHEPIRAGDYAKRS